MPGFASPAFTFVGSLAGSTATGLLYERTRLGVVVFAVVVQIASLPLFALARRWQESSV